MEKRYYNWTLQHRAYGGVYTFIYLQLVSTEIFRSLRSVGWNVWILIFHIRLAKRKKFRSDKRRTVSPVTLSIPVSSTRRDASMASLLSVFVNLYLKLPCLSVEAHEWNNDSFNCLNRPRFSSNCITFRPPPLICIKLMSSPKWQYLKPNQLMVHGVTVHVIISSHYGKCIR